jgi:hypothetical protein
MFQINDPTLKRLVIEHLIEQLESGGEQLDALLRAGVDPALLDVLRRRSARDLIAAAKDVALQVSATVDAAAVELALHHVEIDRLGAERQEYFVRQGAPLAMLLRLFPLTREDVRLMRSFLAPEAGSGPAKLAPLAERSAIHEAWAAVLRAHPERPELTRRALERERIYTLHQRFPHYTIAVLWNTLSEFDDKPGSSTSGATRQGAARPLATALAARTHNRTSTDNRKDTP